MEKAKQGGEVKKGKAISSCSGRSDLLAKSVSVLADCRQRQKAAPPAACPPRTPSLRRREALRAARVTSDIPVPASSVVALRGEAHCTKALVQDGVRETLLQNFYSCTILKKGEGFWKIGAGYVCRFLSYFVLVCFEAGELLLRCLQWVTKTTIKKNKNLKSLF